jgi:hypothetical protein
MGNPHRAEGTAATDATAPVSGTATRTGRPAPRRAAVAAIGLVAVALVAAAGTHAWAGVPTRQTGLVGRYVLRSVNGKSLPAPVPGEDPRHKVEVIDGVLEINTDGTYLCRTVTRKTFHAFVEQAADTISGGYDTYGGGFLTLGHRAVGVPPKTADTVATSGYQIIWTHGVGQGLGAAQFVYSK